ncbi:MAG: transglutaminase domain-containing protein [Candidatus Bathyarchaeum sp.]|nr:MAG: transglutaminase domain-containing protein [Candidatus Bathyarchaeum sp.]
MNKLLIISIVLLALLVGGMAYYMTRPVYPKSILVYRYRYQQMMSMEMKKELINFTNQFHPITERNYIELLEWEHIYLKYTEYALNFRPELPIPIIIQGKGRCGEFALLYTGLLLANDIDCRLVVDCSVLWNQSKKAAGDHMWVEVLVQDKWLHVDPTENKIDQPKLYSNNWNKDVNLVYAIHGDNIIDVTETYR